MDDLELVLKVKFYQADSGKEPVREWLKQLAPAERKLIGEDIKTVQFGWPLGMPLVRKLETDLWEAIPFCRKALRGCCLRCYRATWCFCMASLRNRKEFHKMS